MLVKPIWFPGKVIIACVICTAVGFKHSDFVCCLSENSQLAFEPHQTLHNHLLLLHLSLQTSIEKWQVFFSVLCISVTWDLCSFQMRRNLFFFPCVQLVIYDLYEQGIVIVLVFIDVLVTVAAIVPRLSCKTHRIYYKALCSDSTDSRLSKSWTEFFPLPNRRGLSYIQHEE